MRAAGQGTRIVKNGKTYYRVKISLRDELNSVITKTFERKTLASAQNAAAMYLAKHGRTIERDPGTLAELFREVDHVIWSATGEKNRANMNIYRVKWEKALGEAAVRDITSPILTRHLHAICKGQSASFVAKAARAIRQALAYAVSDLGWITSNPADYMRLPKGTKGKFQYPPITQAEYDRVLALAPKRNRLLIRLVGECAMRPIEAARVRPEHLFTIHDRWLVRIPKSKTAAGIRSVPVPDDLVKEIEARTDEEWEGIQDASESVRRWWRSVSETRWYDVRGWRIDEWRRLGVPEQLRSYLAGHTDPKFTQTVYETLTEEDTLKMFPKGESV